MGRDEFEALVRAVEGLAPEALAEVRDFAEFLKMRATATASPAPFAPISPAVADSMALAIEEACEVVHPDDGFGLSGHQRCRGDPPRS